MSNGIKKKKNFFKKAFGFLAFMVIPKPKKLQLLAKVSKRKLSSLIFRYCINISILYFLLYIIFFIFNFRTLGTANQLLKAGYEAEGRSTILYYLNSYPFNIFYIYVFWFLLVSFLTLFCFLLLTILGEPRKPFAQLRSNSLYATSFIFLSAFPLLLVNTLFPISQDTTLGVFSLIIAIWIIIIMIGIMFSSIAFGRLGVLTIGQNINRSIFSWVTSVFAFIYMIYSIVK